MITKLKYKKNIKKPIPESPDILQEQLEKPLTTIHCPESVKGKELFKVRKHPEQYIEINMINKNRMVDNFYIKANNKNFKYRTKKYKINEKRIYLLPAKTGFFMLTCFYKENTVDPKNFQKSNKGITSKALTLLYKEKLYADLFSSENTKYNFFIALFSVILLIMYCMGLYLLFRT